MKRYLLLSVLCIFSASFGQNYKFLGPYTSDGTPQYFVTSDVITTQTLDLINKSGSSNIDLQGNKK
ncbi:hypothetical protein B4N84_07780 [Flavobacterium sp. IR1]|nr:hypothetical protein B4N84_07780 [Flavobacterium sp. IR1]